MPCTKGGKIRPGRMEKSVQCALGPRSEADGLMACSIYPRACRTSAGICLGLLLFCIAYATAQPSFNVAFTWDGTLPCFDPQSPPFMLSGVPTGTKALRFAMKDLDAPDFNHGGGTVAFDGQQRIERGAFTYRGPCPPRGQHRYEWTISAQDAAGRTLATATIETRFPPATP